MSGTTDLCGLCKTEPVIPGDICDSCYYKLRAEGRAAPATVNESLTVGGAEAFDFRAHLARQAAWSEKTFGPGARAKGVVDHIRKELLEIEADPGDLKEWIDVAILALDGAWRSGASPDEIIAALTAKQAKNEARKWPDWRTMPADKAIEHDRSGEKRECQGCKYSGFDIADGPFCVAPEVLKVGPWGLTLSSRKLAEICPAPAPP